MDWRGEPLMSLVRLVRHGRATGGWDADPDPGLDEVGAAQARDVADRLAPLGPLPIVCSPMRRCQETAAPLASAWGVVPVTEPSVSEIPSPPGVPMGERVPWLRAAMVGRWSDLGPRWTDYHRTVIDVVRRLTAADGDSVVVSHFIAINAVIGACVGDDRLVLHHLDNTSVTVVDQQAGELVLVEAGAEADTLIR
jgi:broad specificity phosphatase PhoE